MQTTGKYTVSNKRSTLTGVGNLRLVHSVHQSKVAVKQAADSAAPMAAKQGKETQSVQYPTLHPPSCPQEPNLRVPDVEAEVPESAGYDVSRGLRLQLEENELYHRIGGSVDDDGGILCRVAVVLAVVHFEERVARGVVGLAPAKGNAALHEDRACLLYTSPSPRD